VVPIFTARWPSRSQIWRVKLATEVLPLVPVTATTVSGPGPNQSAAAWASVARASSATMRATFEPDSASAAISAPARSVRIATAPSSIAPATKRAPWTCVPGSAAKSVPGRTLRLSMARPVTEASAPAKAVRPSSARDLAFCVIPAPARTNGPPPKGARARQFELLDS
jgi:hypothetical protein